MDQQNTPTSSRRNSRVTNISVPNTSPPPSLSPTGVYRPQMPSPRYVVADNWGFGAYANMPSPNVMPDNNWAYANMVSQTPIISYGNMVPIQQPLPSPPPRQPPTASRWELRDEPSQSGDDDVDAIPETQQQPSPPPEPEPQPKRKSRKGKKATTSESTQRTGKAACKTWSENEEFELISAYIDCSEDSTVGNNRTAENFWEAVKASFDVRMGYGEHVRSQDSCMSKAKMLISSVAKFACHYNNASNQRKSGEDDQKVLGRAKTRYRGETGKTFGHEHVWRILRNCPKFDAVKMSKITNIHAPNHKRSKTSETPTDSPAESDARTNVNVDTDTDDRPMRQRPVGRNQARRAGSSSSTAQPDGMTELINTLNSSSTMILEEISERSRQRAYKIYMKPHAHLSGNELEATLMEKQRYREKYGWP